MNRSSRSIPRFIVGALLSVSFVVAVRAQAGELPCGPVDPGAISVDGLLGDWRDVPGVDVGGTDANLSASLRCNVEGSTLYLVVDVRDQAFIRRAAAGPGDDHLELSFEGKRLQLWPGDNAKAKLKAIWAGGAPRGVKQATALQEHGWALELSVPLGSIPHIHKGSPSVKLTATIFDSDTFSDKPERQVRFDGIIAFASAAGAVDAFLADRGLKAGDIWKEQPLHFGKEAAARLYAAGKFLASVSDGYVYLELPVKDRTDVRDLRVVDLAGDGRDTVFVRYLERGTTAGQSREILAGYRFNREEVRRVFAIEVQKTDGARKLDTKVAFPRRGKATDLLVEALPAVGVPDAASWREAAAEDVIPILLPWAEKRALYQFRGDEYVKK